MAEDRIDRGVYLAWSGKPHNPSIAHLERTHNLPGTAGYLLEKVVAGEKDPDTARLLVALRAGRDADPASPTFGCLKWYLEDAAIYDTNAAFFICSSLVPVALFFPERLSPEEMEQLRGVFADVLPWFRRMAESPSLFYPNKCISDAAMLLAAGTIAGDAQTAQAGRDFCHRYLDYYFRRGTGWGEDHSPVYTTVIMEMLLLILALEPAGDLHDKARHMADALMGWVAFHDGVDAVPSIRGYNFERKIEVKYGVRPLLAGQSLEEAPLLLRLLAERTGYRYAPAPLQTPRERRWRTFDEQYSVSYIGEHARLGTLSHYPLMPNTTMHDGWGLGWQSKPAAFIVGREEYGVLEWMTEDDEGVVRQHEAAGSIHDWASRHLFKRVGFHPEVVFAAHQEGRAAIIFREVHQVHSPTRRLEDRWCLSHGAGRVLLAGRPWEEEPACVPPQWILLEYAHAAVALYPLCCRVLDAPDDDVNPQRRTAGALADAPVYLERTDRGITLSRRLVDGHEGIVTQPLFFSGWCVVLLDRPEDALGLRVTETFHEDGEVPRTYGELIRTVELATPAGTLRLTRDMLTGREERSARRKG